MSGAGRLTQPEIAARHGVSIATVRLYRRRPEWPAPAGKRGRSAEFDADAVDAAFRAIRAVPGDDGADPGELLDMKGAALEAGIAYATVRADVSRGRWPEPKPGEDGRWTRQQVRDEMAARRPNKRRNGGARPGPGRQQGAGSGEA